MSERKAINKYYPPDFDPSKIVKKRKKVKTGSSSLPTVRLMTPFSMKCDNCGDYISKSRKFNARKETTSDTYLGMKIVRFHIKCPRCASEILFRTDPKSANFVVEFGAKKNYDSADTNKSWKDETVEEILDKLEKEEEDVKLKEAQKDKNVTSLEELEKKMNDLKRQQELSDEIEELRNKNKRLNDSLTSSELLKGHQKRIEQAESERQKSQDEEDERLASLIFEKQQGTSLASLDVKKKKEDIPDHYSISDRDRDAGSPSNSDSDSSDSEYEQPLLQPTQKQKVIPTKIKLNKRPVNKLGVSFKRVRR
jgi:hypothetical protein